MFFIRSFAFRIDGEISDSRQLLMLDESFDLIGCLEGVREGDQAASRALVEHLYPLVIRIVRAHLPRRVPEEDLVQEIYIKMFRRMDQYEGKVPFPNWVSRIAVTTCIDHLRAQKRRPEYRWADLSEEEANVLDAVTRDESGPDPADSTAAKELVGKLLDTLGATDRTVITMLDLEQKSLAEISAITGWSQTMIKVRAFRARRKLQQAFKRLQERESHEQL
ncbi:MAG: RNA polymerase sigma factor, partial [Opitutaceae bacterium]